MSTFKEKAEELIRKYYSFGLNNPAQSFSWYECKQCALIAVDEQITLIKKLIKQSTEVHQALSTPKKICTDILNPTLKELERIKSEIEKL
jgi:hypothetical protein